MTIFSFNLQVSPLSSTYLNKYFKWTTVPNYFEIHAQMYKWQSWQAQFFYHFLISPSSVPLTFNLPEQMFQMTLLLLKDNKCDKLFWNLYINVQVMARTICLWPFYHLTFKCDLDFQHTWINVSNGTFTLHGQQLCQIILKSMLKYTSYGPDKSGWMDTHAQPMHSHTYTALKLWDQQKYKHPVLHLVLMQKQTGCLFVKCESFTASLLALPHLHMERSLNKFRQSMQSDKSNLI